jgi:hypothetical protein
MNQVYHTSARLENALLSGAFQGIMGMLKVSAISTTKLGG